MKKKKIIIIVVLFLLLLTPLVILLTLGGKTKVDKKNPEAEQRVNVIEKDEKTGEEYYLLADFENYFECTQVNYMASFGTVTEISSEDEPDKVPYGKQSVKLEILGTEETWTQRRPTIRFNNSGGFFNKTTDFSNMSKFTFDIYNAQDYEACIRFFIDTNVQKNFNQESTLLINTDYQWNVVNVIELEPNSWNHVEILAEDIRYVKYDDNLKPYYVYGAEALEEVGGFNIEFDRGDIHEKQEVFYFDNVRVYLKSE